jgi:hypothetical protein
MGQSFYQAGKQFKTTGSNFFLVHRTKAAFPSCFSGGAAVWLIPVQSMDWTEK